MASVLTPYKVSDGNNPYTTDQLKAHWATIEPMAREPGKYTPEEKLLLQKHFLLFIKEGNTATKAVTRLQALAMANPEKWPYAEFATFMAWKSFDPQFADAWEVAYAMGTDALEDVGVDIAKAGNASMLQFLLKMRNPQRYNPKTEVVGSGAGGAIEHVHTIRLVAATAEPKQVEHDPNEGPRLVDATDAEIVGPDGEVL